MRIEVVQICLEIIDYSYCNRSVFQEVKFIIVVHSIKFVLVTGNMLFSAVVRCSAQHPQLFPVVICALCSVDIRTSVSWKIFRSSALQN